MPGEKGLAAGRRLGLHDVPCGAARGGPTYVVELRDVVFFDVVRCFLFVLIFLIVVGLYSVTVLRENDQQTAY